MDTNLNSNTDFSNCDTNHAEDTVKWLPSFFVYGMVFYLALALYFYVTGLLQGT